MIEIGLTGGIGSGKSTVADGLVARGAVLIDADRIVRELQEPGAPVFEAMVERWGPRIVAADGTLDRAAVAAIVFGDEDDQYANLAGIVVVDIDPELAVRRLVKFRGFSRRDALARIRNQASREARRAVADRVIDNSGTLEELRPQIDFVWSWIKTLPHPSLPPLAN